MKRNKNFLSGFSVKLAALLLSAARTVVDHAGDTITLPDKIKPHRDCVDMAAPLGILPLRGIRIEELLKLWA